METTWRWVSLTAIAPIAWGSTYLVTAHLLPADQPLWGAAFRALPAAMILLLVVRRLPRGHWWWRSFVLGTLTVGGFFVLVFQAAQLLPSGLAATIMATSAGVLLLLAWPLLGERPSLLTVGGATLGMVGVVVLIGVSPTRVEPLGVLASIGAMLMSSLGFVLTKRWTRTASDAPDPTTMAGWQLAAGAIVLVPAALLAEGLPHPFTPASLAGFGYVTVVATALAYVAWFTGLRHLPAGTVGTIGLLNPVTGVAIGALVAGEVFGGAQAGATILVLGGILLSGRAGRRRPAEVVSPRAGG